MPRPERIIDTHQHINWNQRDAAALVADCDTHGIDCAWLLTWLIGPAEFESADYQQYLDPALVLDGVSHPGIPLNALLAARERWPGRFVVGYCPNPLWPNAAKLLEVAHRMHGIRVCGEWKFRQAFDDPRSLEIFAVAGRLGLPVVLHLDVPYLPTGEGARAYQPHWFGGTVAHLERALQACPDTIFIGHAPGFWREISGDAEGDPRQYPDGLVVPGGRIAALFDIYPNLYADLSAGSGLGALSRDPVHAVDFLTRFADRLLFGRDYYGTKLHEFLSSLPLADDVVQKIYWRNALRLVPGP